MAAPTVKYWTVHVKYHDLEMQNPLAYSTFEKAERAAKKILEQGMCEYVHIMVSAAFVKYETISNAVTVRI